MPAAAATRPAFDIKSTAWTLTALRLHAADPAALQQALDQRFADSPGLFDGEPVVVDLSPLREADAALDWPALLAPLRAHGMLPVGVQGGSAAQMAGARAAGLVEVPLVLRPPAVVAVADTAAVAAAELSPDWPAEVTAEVPAAGPAELPAAAAGSAEALESAEVAETAEAAAAPTTSYRAAMVVDKPLRSGQRVYARGCDLVVLSVVSFGAEAIADGSIHVYAPLRGRAIAGARGDTTARIFSTCLEPQLVSIAGIYRTTETELPAQVRGKPAQVRLEGEKIIVEPLAP